jgi:hypothetical protein
MAGLFIEVQNNCNRENQMSNKKWGELTEAEVDLLYNFFENKILYGNMVELKHFLPQFNGVVYDSRDMQVMLNNLERAGYITTRRNFDDCKKGAFGMVSFADAMGAKVEYGIKDRVTYERLQRLFRNRAHLDRIKRAGKQICEFLLKHIIAAIIAAILVSILTSLAIWYLSSINSVLK